MNDTESRICHATLLGFNHTTTVKTILFLTITINCFGVLVSVLQNSVVIWTVVRNSELHRPSFVLLGCLATIDLLTGSIAQPGWILYRLAEYYKEWQLSCKAYYAVKLSYVLVSMSFGMLMIISIDRYLALQFHLRYEALVTIPRLFLLVAIIAMATVILLIPFLMHEYTIGTITTMIAIIICVVIITYCYSGIYRVTRKHQRQICSQRSCSQISSKRSMQDRIVKIKKSSMTFFLITMLVLASVVPGLAFNVSYLFVGYTGFVVPFFDISTTLWLMNASVNPMVYFWRMTELRRAVKGKLRRFEQKFKIKS